MFTKNRYTKSDRLVGEQTFLNNETGSEWNGKKVSTNVRQILGN